MATFNETCPPTSGKYVAAQGIVTPNSSKAFQTFCSHSSVYALQKQPKNLNFQIFLGLTDHLVATLNKTHAPTSKTNLAEQGIVKPNWSKTFQSFWWYSHPFALEKQPKNLNFKTFYTSDRAFCGCFQWNTCTYF